ncbi:MAG: hypothetical protein ACKVWV_01125 [Planctomycetota bacterium]
MAEKDQFFSFDEALKELRLKEEELKRLVSEGEIRAFREGDTMKLRRADVESLRSELSGGEVVDLGEVDEELVFEDEADPIAETGMATEEIEDVETIIEDDGVEDVGEVEIEDEVVVAAAEPAAGRRSTRAVEVIETPDSPLSLAVLVVTALLLVAAIPLWTSIGRAAGSGAARTIASIFGVSL